MKNWIKVTPLFLFTLIAGCASVNTMSPQAPRSAFSANDYKQLAANAKGNDKNAYLLNAANRYLQNQHLAQAQQILYQLPTQTLTPALVIKKRTLQANIYLLQGKLSATLSQCQSLLQNTQLTTADKINIHQLMAYAYEKQGQVLPSIAQQSQRLALQTHSGARHQTLLAIWNSVSTLSVQNINQFIAQNPSQNASGWLMLALITKVSSDPNTLITKLQSWRAEYPNHPASTLLPSSLRATIVTPSRVQHIALLLPLSGPYQHAGIAIRNGFFAAYYRAKKINANAPTITVQNTQGNNVVALYQNAVKKGADFVVGPLIKNNVTRLANDARLSVPTLALNTTEALENRRITNLYTFGLPPTDEARQAATKAFYDGHDHAVVIAPNNAWGRNIAKAFIAQWQSMGGRIMNSMTYTNQQSLSSNIRSMLHIEKSQARAIQIKRALREKLRFVPRRRKDVDMVFLVAQPVIARQIRPLLKFYYAGDLAVYATSSIYRGIPNPSRDRDLNGILFCDMPWVLTPGQLSPAFLNTLQRNAKSIWRTSYRRYPKLYALGVDAFDLVNHLNKMALLSNIGNSSATGKLFLTRSNHVYRQLSWALFSRGRPKPIH